MEKMKKELGESVVRLKAIVDYLANEKKLMASKSNHIFMLDMQDYITTLSELAPSDSVVSIEPEEVKQINRLLTRQYELLRNIQRESTKLPQDAVTEKERRRFRRAVVINQLLLQDNLTFQSKVDAKKISGSIRIGKKKSWFSRMFGR